MSREARVKSLLRPAPFVPEPRSHVLVVSLWTQRATCGTDGAPPVHQLWKKEGDTWRLWARHANWIPAPPAAKPD
jgi:hypothetical protein